MNIISQVASSMQAVLTTVADVAGKALGAQAVLAEFARYLVALVLLAAGNDHVCSVFGEHPCCGLTETHGGAGDERHLAAEIE